jgi:2-haloacid dehalogenase
VATDPSRFSRFSTDTADNREKPAGTVAFDVIGTLVSLEKLRPILVDRGAEPHTLELWFAESLRDYFSISHSGGYSRLGDVLRAGLARHPVGDRDAVMNAFPRLDPVPGAGDACRLLAEAGFKIVALTNGSEELTNSLLANSGIAQYFDAVLSCDSILVSKPHPRVYAMVKEVAEGDAWLVASHAWDTAGAGRAGLRTVLVYPRPEQVPSVFPAPDAVVPDLVSAAESIVSSREGHDRDPV